MLKITPTFLNRSIHQFHGVFCNFYKSFMSVPATAPLVLCLRSFRFLGLLTQTLSLRNLHRIGSGGAGSCGRGGQRPLLTRQSPKSSYKKAVVSAVWRSPRPFLKPVIPFVFFQHSYELKHPTFDDYRGFSCTARAVSALF